MTPWFNLPIICLVLLYIGKSAVFVLSALALRVVRSSPVLRMHSNWLILGVICSGLAIVVRSVTTVGYLAGAHLPESITSSVTYLDWGIIAISVYSSFCLLRLMLALTKSEEAGEASPVSADVA